MLKNIKRFISLTLPVVAITMTSCGNMTKTVTYEQLRRFAEENYDQYALDTVPATYTANFDTLRANIDIEYRTPEGGKDAFTIAFGIGGIHIKFKDKYAISLSSVLVDNIEKIYSDFVGIAITLKEVPPIDMFYQLFDSTCTKIDFTTSQKLLGSVLVRLLQFLFGSLDLFSSTFGYIPVDEMPTNPILVQIFTMLQSILDELEEKGGPDLTMAIPVLLTLMNNATFTVSNSSKAHGETFDTYITTDCYGFINKLDFNFKSSFNISGLAAIKKYASDEPKEGDYPIATDAPYYFSATGSFDFDFNIVSEFAY